MSCAGHGTLTPESSPMFLEGMGAAGMGHVRTCFASPQIQSYVSEPQRAFKEARARPVRGEPPPTDNVRPPGSRLRKVKLSSESGGGRGCGRVFVTSFGLCRNKVRLCGIFVTAGVRVLQTIQFH